MQTNPDPQDANVQPARPILKWLELLLLAAILTVFFLVTMNQINLPGLHPDEAQEVIPAVQLLRGQNVETLRNSGITLLGRRLPLMIVDYIGTVNTYLAVPFFSLFGISTFSLRLMSVLTSGVALVLLYMLGRSLYSPAVGLIAVALLAVHPSFVFWSRQGVFVTFITVPLTLGATLLGWCWWRGKAKHRALALYGGAFLIGLALAAKLLAIWVVFGIGGAFIVLYPRQLWWALRERSLAPLGISLNWKQFALATLSFLLGAIMLVIYNVQTAGTWLVIKENLRTSYYGVNNLEIFGNLLARFNGLNTVLTGRQFWYLGAEHASPWWPRILPGGGLVALAVVLWHTPADWRKLVFPYLALTLMLSASVFTVSDLLFTHLALMLPWVTLSMAAALVFLMRHLRPRWVAIWLATLVGLGLIATDLKVDRDYHQALSVTGGYGAHNAAIYRLVDYLQEESDPQPYAVDWGIQDPVQFLSEGQINPVEITGFEFEAGDEFTQRVVNTLQDAEHIYIFHGPGNTVFIRLDEFKHILADNGYQISDNQRVHDVTGRRIFDMFRIEPIASSS